MFCNIVFKFIKKYLIYWGLGQNKKHIKFIIFKPKNKKILKKNEKKEFNKHPTSKQSDKSQEKKH